MGIEAVLDQALNAFGGNQTQLAEALGVKGPTVNRWRLGKSGIDYESCLRLARVTGLPAATVLRAADRDPSLLPSGDPEAPDRRPYRTGPVQASGQRPERGLSPDRPER